MQIKIEDSIPDDFATQGTPTPQYLAKKRRNKAKRPPPPFEEYPTKLDLAQRVEELEYQVKQLQEGKKELEEAFEGVKSKVDDLLAALRKV